VPRRADLPALRTLWAHSYVLEEPAYSPVFGATDLSITRVVDDGTKAVACGELLPLKMHLGGRSVGMGGVAAVASAFEDRRRGHVETLLVGILEELHRRDVPWSLLLPFSAPFYARYGWATSEERRTVRVPLSALSTREKPAGRVRLGSANDISLCDSVYQSWAQRYNLTLIRTRDWWKKRVLGINGWPGPKRYLYIAEDATGNPDGYVVFSYRTPETEPGDQAFEREIRLRELAWSSPRGRAALLAFLGDQDSQAANLVWRIPSDEPLLATLPLRRPPRIDVRLWMMSRIVDVEGALAGKRAPRDPERSAVIAVEDTHAPWNAGSWLFEPAGGFLRVCRTGRRADVTVPVGLLSQIAVGYVSCESVLTAGLVQGSRPDALRVLDGVSAGLPPFMSDSY
jgi:predicted acetyltransferase